MADDERTSFATCPLCEATCGLEIETRGRQVVSIRGDEEDVFSKGYLCPKAYALKELDADPDRLRTPLVRRNGRLEPATWDEAYAEIERRVLPILERHGRDAVAVYMGNPSAHHLALVAYTPTLHRTLRTKNLFSASSVDQMPKQVSGGLMFGTVLSVPIPDLDRTSHLVIVGANPAESNGSLMTAPDVVARLKGIRARGGKIVVLDPRRTRTAELATEHHFVRPGSDALLLAAMVNVLFAENLVRTGTVGEHLNGLGDVERALAGFTPEAVTTRTGVAPDVVRRLARELAAAESAAVYGRIGSCTQEMGTLSSWLVDVLNVVTGNLDRPGGALFTKPANGAPHTRGTPGRGKGVRFGRRASRVRGFPEVYGELPAACLAEEIETPGEGQIRALVTIAGNPVLSTPEGDRLARALDGLELLVALDLYVNETSSHAHVVLPAPSPLEQSHYDLLLRNFAVRNVATYSPAVFPLAEGAEPEWRTLLRLAAILGGQGKDADLDAMDDRVAFQAAEEASSAPTSPLHGVDPREILASVAPHRGPERLLDIALRSGPYGARPDGPEEGLSLAALEANPHGIDFGPLEPRVPEALRTPSGKIELAPAEILADVERLRAMLVRDPQAMVLVGRRDLRSNNSWMHNLPVLVKGKPRCTAHLHPADAARLGVADGETVRVASRTGAIELPAEVTDRVMPGVVSVPHGWGHDAAGARLSVAAAHAGASYNRLVGGDVLDPLSGNAVLTGIAVEVTPSARPA